MPTPLAALATTSDDTDRSKSAVRAGVEHVVEVGLDKGPDAGLVDDLQQFEEDPWGVDRPQGTARPHPSAPSADAVVARSGGEGDVPG